MLNRKIKQKINKQSKIKKRGIIFKNIKRNDWKKVNPWMNI